MTLDIVIYQKKTMCIDEKKFLQTGVSSIFSVGWQIDFDKQAIFKLNFPKKETPYMAKPGKQIHPLSQ